MIPNSGSGCCDSYTGFWCRVGSGSNLVDIQSFLEIGKIGDSGRVSGRARETSEIDECYGSENNKDSDNDDEFDEGECRELPRPLGEGWGEGFLGIWCRHRWRSKGIKYQ